MVTQYARDERNLENDCPDGGSARHCQHASPRGQEHIIAVHAYIPSAPSPHLVPLLGSRVSLCRLDSPPSIVGIMSRTITTKSTRQNGASRPHLRASALSGCGSAAVHAQRQASGALPCSRSGFMRIFTVARGRSIPCGSLCISCLLEN